MVKKFGRWNVVGETLINGKHFYICKCSCKKETIKKIRIDSLNSVNGSRDCGCINKEKIAKEFESNYGFKVINFDSLKNSRSKVDCLTPEGFKIRTTIDYLRRGHVANPFDKNNPYSIWNINNIWIPNYAPEYWLLSKQYLGAKGNLKWIHKPTGNIFVGTWANFSKKKGTIKNRKTPEQNFNTINNLLKKDIYDGWKIEDNQKFDNLYYTDYYFRHRDGWKGKTSFNSLKNGQKIQLFTPYFPDTSTHNMYLWYSMNGKKKINDNQEYKGNYEFYEFTCENHGIFTASWANIYSNNPSCNKCYKENNIGKNHHSWKGGITGLQNHLRTSIKKWKEESLTKYDSKCVITGEYTDIVHHLYGFDSIVKEVLYQLKLEIKQVGEYTEDEISIIRKLCLELHYKYGLGVCLTAGMHKKFHSIYGYGKNTKEQFAEFYNNEIINNKGDTKC